MFLEYPDQFRFSVTQKLNLDLGRRVVEVSRSYTVRHSLTHTHTHTHTHARTHKHTHSEGLLRTSDQPSQRPSRPLQVAIEPVGSLQSTAMSNEGNGNSCNKTNFPVVFPFLVTKPFASDGICLTGGR